MSDLFKKLNVLVKSRVGDLLGESGGSPPTPVDPLSKQMDQNVADLRERINQAIEHEEKLQNQISTLEKEIAEMDRQADQAVKDGREEVARHIISKMQWSQQRLEMVRSDLREHQIVAQELIQQVNLLEATVADARRSRESEAEDAQISLENASSAFNKVIDDARSTISAMSERIQARDEGTPDDPQSNLEDQPANETAVQDDLDARRNRLSKR